MKKTKLLPISLLAISLFSCEPNDPVDPNQEELITTVNLDLESNGLTYSLNYQDLDGDGGNAPVITLDTLAANSTYSGSITLFNESVTPAEEITPEIFDEASDHQFFFTSNGTSSFTYSDQDNDGNPIGLSFELTTGNAANETFTITLRHEPDKSATDVSSGDITNAGGETDIEIALSVIIE
ncbi:MAG: type 1 periplasmic binding fold superfamily protein [Flavobacteriales bacterium]|nr:type 1 periplasmic binding fold superfamily protein [Flavobacteriales bacterium]|tara:strand:- start:346 stop:891 length:546 start_codon:yes stop_codon:yes gene_type:complete